MHSVQRYWLAGFFLILPLLLSAQPRGIVPGELLVKPRNGTDIAQWIAQWERQTSRFYRLKLERTVSRAAGIYLLRFDDRRVEPEELLEMLRAEPELLAVQFNHRLRLRESLPNDPLLDEQWQYINSGQLGGTPDADIDADRAWDIARGGRTARGDTIVICIVDDGTDLNHNDLAGNLWVNREEIPDNGLDDDNNGYVDDYRGWNILSQDDNIAGLDHGTAVNGIVGAVGDNGLGVSGINWQVQLMVVRNGFDTDEASVIEAYAYPLTLRKRYNETGGQEGAFVVATNSSWGIDRALASDAPLWCAFYDSLGAAGILNAAATANLDVDVDLEGDLPTSCPSDYLLAVTSSDRNDQKVTNAGYGLTHIDLAAPGSGVYTTLAGGIYGNISGTSFASPHAAGAVGLLYSSPCPAFADLAVQQPDSAALLVKAWILDGVDTTSLLRDLVLSGGRLNLANSLDLLLAECSSCLYPFNITFREIDDSTATATWTLPDTIQRVDLRFRKTGTAAWQEWTEVAAPVTFDSLDLCTSYEVQFRTFCPSDTTQYSPSFTFSTLGCCDPPQRLRRLSIDSTTALIAWDSVRAATSYVLRYRPRDSLSWDSLLATGPQLLLENLAPCQAYELQVRSDCPLQESLGWSESLAILTKGCGACLDLEYCEPTGLNSLQEWIEEVKLHTLVNRSGNDGGYGDFTGFPATALRADTAYELALTPGFEDVPFSEFFRIWVDLNRDGTFSENEVLFQSDTASTEVQAGMLTIPSSVVPGPVRMRVGMKFRELEAGEACNPENSGFGEYEDYCLTILSDTAACAPPTAFLPVGSEDGTTGFQWDPVPNSDFYIFWFDTLGQNGPAGPSGSVFTVDTNFIDIPEALYDCQLRRSAQVLAVCGGRQSFPTAPIQFQTPCVSSTPDIPAATRASLRATPNPATAERAGLDLWLPARQQRAALEAWLPDGRLLFRQSGLQLAPGPGRLPVAIPANWSGWVIFRLVLDDGTRLSAKMLVR